MLKLNATTYQQVIKDNPKDRLEVIVGDDKQPDFKPQVKICRWGTSEDTNEVNLSIRAQEEVGATLKELPDGTIVYKAKEYEVHQYDKPDASEEGGFEFEWVLKSKPASNVLTATISTKGLDFFYQPALTPKEIAEGASRPPEVIGSYAVYHSTKGGMNDAAGMEYKVGKFCHIYRPKAIDANGVEVWADLLIENGILTVTVPQKFLDDAVYPVRVDPTFGYTSIGASVGFYCNTWIVADDYALSEAGTITLITWGLKTSSAVNIKVALYDASQNLLTNTTGESISGVAYAWHSVSITPYVADAATYILAINADGADSVTFTAYDSGGVRFFEDNHPYSFWDNPGQLNSSTLSTRKVSVYATYTASGGTAIKDIIGGGFIMFPR